jgi:mycothiol synthase
MTSDEAPVEVDAKTAEPDFWKRYHAYRRMRNAETHPDDPMRPDNLEEMRLQRDSPFDFTYRYEIAREGVMLSWFGGSTVRPGAPGYDSNKHVFDADWSVRPDHRRRGIGRSWLPVVVELMDRHGCTVLTIGTEEDSGRAFMKWLGAEARLTEGENRLRLADVDWATARKWIVDGQGRSPGTRLEMHDGRVPEAIWEDYTEQFTKLLSTIPLEQLDHGAFVLTPEHMRDWYVRADVEGSRHHVIIAREPDGVISGITELTWAPYRPALVHQMLTAVGPEARGRGLGKWIKAAMLDHVRELYPQVEWVTTNNAGSNAPMLAINKKLGFKHYSTSTVYQIGRDELAARIRAKAASA